VRRGRRDRWGHSKLKGSKAEKDQYTPPSGRNGKKRGLKGTGASGFGFGHSLREPNLRFY